MTALTYAFSQLVCWLFFRVGFGLRVTGREHVPRRGAFVLASNHVSYLDPPLVGAACPRRLTFMARADLFTSPLLGAYMRAVGVIPLPRGEQDLSTIREAVARLRDGEVIAIFPEGGRQFSGTLGQARRGVAVLATMAQIPIVPVVVRGTFQALPPNSRRLRRAKIRVAFGPPIPYDTEPPLPLPVSVTERPGAALGIRSRRHDHERLAAAVTQAWHRLEEQLNR